MKVFTEFQFNKNFGQNFISDKNLLSAIVKDSGISADTEVLEIGTGVGTLTDSISSIAKKVVTYEIDKKLTEFLREKFKNSVNVVSIIGDALKIPIKQIEKNFAGDYHLIANIPYYITTPLIFKFLEQTDKVKSMTIMVQKEVAKKIIAKENEKNYGVLSVMLQYYCNCKITRIVNRKMFTPKPKVDSAIIKLEKKQGVLFDKDFKKFVSGIFAMKRKTLINNLLKMGYEKNIILDFLKEKNFLFTIRAEELSLNNIRHLFEYLDNLKMQ